MFEECFKGHKQACRWSIWGECGDLPVEDYVEVLKECSVGLLKTCSGMNFGWFLEDVLFAQDLLTVAVCVSDVLMNTKLATSDLRWTSYPADDSQVHIKANLLAYS